MVAIGIMAMIAGGSFKVYENIQTSQSRLQNRIDQINHFNQGFTLIEQDLRFAIQRAIKIPEQPFGQDEELIRYGGVFVGHEKGFEFSRGSAIPTLVETGVPHSEQRRLAYVLKESDDIAEEEQALERHEWKHLDPGPEELAVKEELLKGLESIELRYYGLKDSPENAALIQEEQQRQQQLQQNSDNPIAQNQQPLKPKEYEWYEQWPPGVDLEASGVNGVQDVNEAIALQDNNPTSQSDTGQVNQVTQSPLPRLIELRVESPIFGKLVKIFTVGVGDDALIIDAGAATVGEDLGTSEDDQGESEQDNLNDSQDNNLNTSQDNDNETPDEQNGAFDI